MVKKHAVRCWRLAEQTSVSFAAIRRAGRTEPQETAAPSAFEGDELDMHQPVKVADKTTGDPHARTWAPLRARNSTHIHSRNLSTRDPLRHLLTNPSVAIASDGSAEEQVFVGRVGSV